MQPRPSSSSDAPGKADDDVLEATTWGASDPAIRAQLERELAAIRGQLAMRQRISEGRRQLAQFDNPAFESVRPPTADGDVSDVASETSSWRSSRPPSAAAKYAQPPPRDKVAERVDKKVKGSSLIEDAPASVQGIDLGDESGKKLFEGIEYDDEGRHLVFHHFGAARYYKINAVFLALFLGISYY